LSGYASCWQRIAALDKSLAGECAMPRRGALAGTVAKTAYLLPERVQRCVRRTHRRARTRRCSLRAAVGHTCVGSRQGERREGQNDRSASDGPALVVCAWQARIARQMGLHPSTVSRHVRAILRALWERDRQRPSGWRSLPAGQPRMSGGNLARSPAPGRAIRRCCRENSTMVAFRPRVPCRGVFHPQAAMGRRCSTPCPGRPPRESDTMRPASVEGGPGIRCWLTRGRAGPRAARNEGAGRFANLLRLVLVGPEHPADLDLRASVASSEAGNASTQIRFSVSNRSAQGRPTDHGAGDSSVRFRPRRATRPA
jgi:hypothetical protein